MKRACRKDKIELETRVGPAWDGDANKLAANFKIPEGYKLAEVKRAGNKYTFVYTKDVARVVG